MEEKKEKNKIVILLIVIIVALLVLVLLFATGIIKFKLKNTINNDTNLNDKVNISLSIDNVVVDKDAPNSKISVTGTINLSYDSNKYRGIKLSGYCIGTSGEKYHMIGPGDGRTLFYNDGNNNLALAEGIPQNIEYTDGTVKEWSEVDWSNVKIKYCKIDKMTTVLNGVNNPNDWPETILNFEKEFNNTATDNNENIMNNQNEKSGLNGMSDTISQQTSAFGSLEKYFDNYMNYIPVKYGEDGLISYSISELTDKDISMAVWRYIYKNKNGLTSESKLTKEEVLSYLNTYLNLDNYNVKPMQISNNNIFGLEENNGYYVISATPTEFEIPMFEVSKVSYDINTGEVKVNAKEYYIEMGTSKKIYTNNIKLDIKYNETNGAFNLLKMNVEK